LVLIFIGQLNYFRLDPLFNVLRDVIAESPSLRLQVLGAGPQLEHYRKRVDSSGMKSHVTFYGHVPHERIFDYIAKADMAYSDDWSVIGFPMKLFEYMALGKAIIAEGTESVKELLTDGVNALLYANESELKEKILTLAKDAALRKKLGQTARSLMGQHTWERRVEALTGIYQQFVLGTGTT
jgi:glycosyltransferase involved in cell wall biosynthesis